MKAYDRGRGFTLIELLVAVAVTALLLTGLTGVFSSVSDSYASHGRVHDVDAEARAALHLISEDLASLYREGAGTPLSLSLVSDQAASAYPSHELAFFSAKSPAAQKPGEDSSDLCIIGYYLGVTVDSRDPSAAEPRSQKLFRYRLSSGPAFDEIRKIVDDWRDDGIYNGSNGPVPFSGSLLPARTAPADPESASAAPWKDRAEHHDAVAYHVVGFTVVPYYRDASGQLIAHSGDWPFAGVQTGTTHLYHPDALLLELRVVDRERSARITSLTQWRTLASSELRTYSTWVHLN